MFMILRIALIILTCTWQSSCTTSTPTITAFKPSTPQEVAQREEWLTGKWYGDQPTKTGGRKLWIADQNADGTFHLHCKVTHDPVENWEQKEEGAWGVCGKYIVTKMQVAGDTSYYWNVYEITHLSQTDFHYRNVETGNQFRMKKVSSEFTFPR